MSYSLLHESIIELTDETGRSLAADLPGLFALWSGGALVELSGLRPHQRPAIHMFLVQVAAAAMRAHGTADRIAASRETWLERLRAIAHDEAWDLVVQDPTRAAFLQAPIPAAHLDKFKTEDCADNLTTLVLSKNHAVKQSRMKHASPWQWAASLIELQTMSSFGGRGNYGIVRMNGGFGSRPLVSIYPDMRDGARWQRDVEAILGRIPEIEQACPALAGGGHVALWTLPWDGEEQIPLADLDPLFIEVCRRVRFFTVDGSIIARIGNSSASRIAGDKALNGRVGDPWVPINTAEAKVLTVSEDGFTYPLLCKLLIGGPNVHLAPSILQRPEGYEIGDLNFHAAVLVGGQGKTGGYHERTVPVPGNVAIDLFAMEERTTIAAAAEAMIGDVKKVWGALRIGLFCFAQGGPTEIRWGSKDTDRVVSPYGAILDQKVTDIFFSCLWDIQGGKDQMASWLIPLRNAAVEVLESGMNTLPVKSEFRFRASARARRAFFGALFKEFEELRQSNTRSEG